MLSSMAESYGQYGPFILAKPINHWLPPMRCGKSDAQNNASEACAAAAERFDEDKGRELDVSYTFYELHCCSQHLC
jgi:hypothetical protein